MASDARTGDAVALTRELVRIESVNPCIESGGSGEAEVSAFVTDLLTDWGLDAERSECAPGRYNVRASLGPEDGPSLLLNGHLDTVGVADMTVDPFGAAVDGDRMTGRGACDMKAGLAVILAAVHRLRSEPLRGRLHLLFTADEEHASIGMQAAVADGVEADFGIVTEPTSLSVMPAHKGFAWVRATARGRAAHGSRPDVGIDAIRSAARLVTALDELERRLMAGPGHPLLGHGSLHAGTIEGGAAPSVYPERCELRLERRTLPAEDPADFEGEVADVLEGVRRLHPDVEIELETELVREGSDVAPDHPGVSGLLAALEAEGLPPRIEGMTAWVDAAFLNAAGIPSICFGPGSIEQAHSADEWVSLREIEAGADVLTRFARGFLRVEG
jgi:acetylornithine deacetylase